MSGSGKRRSGSVTGALAAWQSPARPAWASARNAAAGNVNWVGREKALTRIEAGRLRAAPRTVERRGRDLNPRPTEPPATVFETAAFDRSATPPNGEGGIRTLESGITPPNALAGRRLQPL